MMNAVFWDVAPCRSSVSVVSEKLIDSIFRVEKSMSEEPAWAGGCSLQIPSSETSVHTRSTRRHITEDGILQEGFIFTSTGNLNKNHTDIWVCESWETFIRIPKYSTSLRYVTTFPLSILPSVCPTPWADTKRCTLGNPDSLKRLRDRTRSLASSNYPRKV
jgi:hypothetical protein